MTNELSRELKDEWHYEKNGTLTPEDVTRASDKIVWWKCNRGHAYQTRIANRSCLGRGCPICSGRNVLKGYNDLATIKPSLAEQWHSTKNNDITPQDVTVGSSKKIWWICEKDHIWQASVSDRSSGYDCPYCSGQKVLKGYNDLLFLRPGLAKEWHPVKNGTLLPDAITLGSGKKIWWQCEKEHEWQTTISNRTNCPYCTGKKVIPGYNDLGTLRPYLLQEWHPAKNKGLTPFEFLVHSNKKAWWLCEKGHEWQAVINNRSKGIGCP